MSMQALAKYREKISRLQASTRRVREKAGETVEHAVRVGECAATGFAIGYAKAKFPNFQTGLVAGLPGDLLVAVVAHTLAFMGIGGAESHLRAVGDAAIATFAQTKGASMAKGGAASLSGESLDKGDLAAYLDY